MARTKADVTKAATAGSEAPRRRGRPAKDATSANTGAGVKKAVKDVAVKATGTGKRGRPAGAKNKTPTKTPAAKPKAATAATTTTSTGKRGRPAGSKNKTPTTAAATSTGAKRGRKAATREFAPAVASVENTAGADRRRAKGGKMEMLPDVKKRAKAGPNDGRRKSGATPKKAAVPKVDVEEVQDEDADVPASAGRNGGTPFGKASPPADSAHTPLLSNLKGIFT